MTASADKVQFLLQNSLQQTLPLVKKGIFSEQELRQIMLQREKHQNKLYSSTFKLSHFLKAIEYQYDLQRQRLFRIKNQEQQNVNPLFKKQGKTDFSIVKRIIKLWDRTMHKYRYRVYLWKQYLNFCIIIKSKKHFYKALTNALRFLPFEIELWQIGIRYEVEIGRNLWKARKLFHKGLKLIPAGQKNINLTKQLIKFQLQFVQTLQQRQKIIQGQDEQGQNNMKFIIGQNNKSEDESQNSQNQLNVKQQYSQLLKLRQYHQVLYIALSDSVSKNSKSQTYFNNQPSLSAQQRFYKVCDVYLKFLNELLQNEQNQLIEHILTTTIKKIQNFRQETNGLKLQNEEVNQVEQNEQIEVQQENQDSDENDQAIQMEVQDQRNQQINNRNNQKQAQISKQQQLYNQLFASYQRTNKLDKKLLTNTLKSLCLKPIQLSNYLSFVMRNFFDQTLSVLYENQWMRLPALTLESILGQMLSQQQKAQKYFTTSYISYLIKQIKKINPIEYISQIQLLKQVIKFYQYLNKLEENNILYRSIMINQSQSFVHQLMKENGKSKSLII